MGGAPAQEAELYEDTSAMQPRLRNTIIHILMAFISDNMQHHLQPHHVIDIMHNTHIDNLYINTYTHMVMCIDVQMGCVICYVQCLWVAVVAKGLCCIAYV